VHVFERDGPFKLAGVDFGADGGQAVDDEVALSGR